MSLAQSKAFVSSLQQLQTQVLQDYEEEYKRSRESHGQFILSLQNSVYAMLKVFHQGTDEASESVAKLKQACDITDVLLVDANTVQDVDETRQSVITALEVTSTALEKVRVTELEHAQGLEAGHLELWKHVNTINADLPTLVSMLQSMMSQLRNSTTELEERIDRNNAKLLTQEGLIYHFQSSTFFWLLSCACGLIIGLVMFQISPTITILMLVALVMCKFTL